VDRPLAAGGRSAGQVSAADPERPRTGTDYAVMRVCRLISEIVGSTKKAARAALLLSAPVFPIAAIYLYLQDNMSRWLLVPGAAAVTLITALIRRRKALKAREAKKAKKASKVKHNKKVSKARNGKNSTKSKNRGKRS